jgi:hypothetical protein
MDGFILRCVSSYQRRPVKFLKEKYSCVTLLLRVRPRHKPLGIQRIVMEKKPFIFDLEQMCERTVLWKTQSGIAGRFFDEPCMIRTEWALSYRHSDRSAVCEKSKLT